MASQQKKKRNTTGRAFLTSELLCPLDATAVPLDLCRLFFFFFFFLPVEAGRLMTARMGSLEKWNQPPEGMVGADQQ